MGDSRNVFTKLDDVGAYSSMERFDGESLVNFRARIQQQNVRRPGPTTQGVQDAIGVALGLSQEPMIQLTAATDLRVDVDDVSVQVSGTSQHDVVNLVTRDPDGYWVFPDIHAVSSGLNDISGLTSTVYASVSGLPGMLLERQSSYIRVIGEPTGRVQQFTLGFIEGVSLTNRVVITNQVEFTDTSTYALQISGGADAVRPGEWTVTGSGLVTSVDAPTEQSFVNYTYNILPSGQQMDLIGNGAKVFNMADDAVQPFLFYSSGIGCEAQDILRDINAFDQGFWGK